MKSELDDDIRKQSPFYVWLYLQIQISIVRYQIPTRSSMSYQVFLVSYAGVPRDHHAIFVETNSDKTGQIFQVTGDIQNGMTYESKPGKRPEDSASFLKKELLGTVSTSNYPRINNVCSQIPPPAKQFNGPKRIDPSIPLRRCQEWTQEAVEYLTGEIVQ